MLVEVQGSGNSTYTVNTDELTCTCPNWRYRCHNYSKDNPNRYCKHIRKVLDDNPNLAPKIYQDLNPDPEVLPDAVAMSDGKIRYPRIVFEPYVVLINNIVSIFDQDVKAHYVCGSYRRMCQMISDLDVLLVLHDNRTADNMYNYIEKMPGYIVEKLWRGDKKASYKFNNIVQVDFKVIPEESIAFSLAHFTGSKEENIRLRRIAGNKKHSLSEYGLRSDEDGQVHQYGIKTEQDLYAWLGVPYKNPWER